MNKFTLSYQGNIVAEASISVKIDIAVKEIECITDLDEGSDNQGSGGTLKGFFYGKEYEFKVLSYSNDSGLKEKELNKIKWVYSYTNDEGVITNVTQKGSTGDTFRLKVDSLEMLGKEISIYAYINRKENEASLSKFCHHRFRYFDKKVFEKELKKRRDTPILIEQHATSLCGTAAIIYQLAKDDKNLFYETFLDFFIKGEGNINNFLLKPNKKLYEMKPSSNNENYPNYSEYSDGTPINPPDAMKQADWIVLAGTRSSDNKSYEGEKGENWDAINWVSYMKKAALSLYGASLAIDETSYFTGFDYTDTLEKIQEDYKNGWNIVFLIDSDMLDDEVSYFGCLTQYHWIVYEGDLKIDKDKKEFEFSFWCWHKINRNRVFAKRVFNTNFMYIRKVS